MKDYCLQLAAAQKTDSAKYNAMREYLQAYVLRILHERDVFKTTAFVGGTALRFLYDLPRFSEDLDFSVHKKLRSSFDHLMRDVKKELELAGYTVEISKAKAKTVQSAFIKFSGLLYEARLSPLKTQKFSVKIEMDTKPPKGAVLTAQVVNKFFPIAFLTYDLPSLLSGKIHALLSRRYTKGRDFFDIAWYLSRFKGLTPNFKLLHNALKQTGYAKKPPTEKNWQECLRRVVEGSDWKTVYNDAVNFLENPKDMDIFTKTNILNLLKVKRND